MSFPEDTNVPCQWPLLYDFVGQFTNLFLVRLNLNSQRFYVCFEMFRFIVDLYISTNSRWPVSDTNITMSHEASRLNCRYQHSKLKKHMGQVIDWSVVAGNIFGTGQTGTTYYILYIYTLCLSMVPALLQVSL